MYKVILNWNGEFGDNPEFQFDTWSEAMKLAKMLIDKGCHVEISKINGN